MIHLSTTFTWIFAVVLSLYAVAMLVVGYYAQRRISTVEDYVVAGRRLKTSFATLTIIATWFGAESLLTTADEVAQHGVRRAMLDPVGISLCLLLAGLLIAGPLWRLGLLTIPDFFRQRYGKLAEFVSACVLVPSYFGWIAAQYLALATLLNQFFNVPVTAGILAVAVLATSYTILGGMWSVTWTDAIQMIFIIAGLLILGYEILAVLGDGDLAAGVTNLRTNTSAASWVLAEEPEARAKILAALSALAIGALGNLPVQDLMQRICSSESDRVARRACFYGAGGYFSLGLLPILAGLSASLILPDVPEEGVVTHLAGTLLSPLLLLVFVLAIVSAVLSTIVSAVLAPAAVLAQNLIQPLLHRFGSPVQELTGLRIQRLCVLVIVAASITLALSGSNAYELVEASYSLSLVSLFAAFLIGLHCSSAPRIAALVSMISGVGLWLLHTIQGWEYFLEPLIAQENRFGALKFIEVLPHELGDALLSTLVFLLLWGSVWFSAAASTKALPSSQEPK